MNISGNTSLERTRSERGHDTDSRTPFPLRLWDWNTAKVLYTTTLYLLILYFCRAARETLTLFLFAILFAYFLAPLVGRLEGPLKGRGKAILAVYVLLLCVVGVGGYFIGSSVVQEARDLAKTLPTLLNRIASGELIQSFGQKHHWTTERVEQAQTFLTTHREDILGYGKSFAAKLASPAAHAWWLILIPILSLFFLKQGEEIAASLTGVSSDPEDKVLIRGMLADVNVMLGSYIRSQIILAGLTLVAYTLVLSVLRVPYALILGPLGGFLEFIPVVGPAIAAVSVFAIAILAGYPHAAWLVIFLGAWRLTQDYISAPRIMGKSLEIDPLVQIFSVLAGGEIAGVVGALISVPVVATLRIIWRRMHPNAPIEETRSGEQYTGPAQGSLADQR